MAKTILFACLFGLATTAADAADGSTLFRLFLIDGTTLVSFGEFARLDDRVIFSMPVGGTLEQPRLYVVTLRASHVDWKRTNQYSSSVRAQWYSETRGEEEFQKLSTDVARVLNEVALLPDRHKGLEIAEAARKALIEWPRAHYGYRQSDIREIVALLDESISDLRASLGITSFDLSFVASTPDEVVTEPVLGAPGPADELAQVFRVASLTERANHYGRRCAPVDAGGATADPARNGARLGLLRSVEARPPIGDQGGGIGKHFRG